MALLISIRIEYCSTIVRKTSINLSKEKHTELGNIHFLHILNTTFCLEI